MNCFKCLAGLLVIAALLSSGCATIVKGSTQDLTINTDPTGANCDLSRSGIVIATVNPTPGLVQIKKDKNDIEVKWKKSGYAETSARSRRISRNGRLEISSAADSSGSRST